MRPTSYKLFVAIVSTWLVLTAAGFGYLWSYAAAPGDPGAPIADWPAATKLQRSTEGAALVMFVHPRCFCSRASVKELAKIATKSRVTPIVVFTRPPGMTGPLTEDGLWDLAHTIPNVQLVMDDDGSEALRFGSETSGHTFVFDADGHRLYTGGITGSRGHEGDNAGADAVLLAVERGDASNSRPIFGCSIFGRALAALNGWRSRS